MKDMKIIMRANGPHAKETELKLKAEVLEQGGIVRIKGPPGSGKTRFLMGAMCLFGVGTKPDPTFGIGENDPAFLQLKDEDGNVRSKANLKPGGQAKADPGVFAIDPKALVQFVTGNYEVTEAARNKQRQAGLLTLADVPADDTAIRTLTGDQYETLKGCIKARDLLAVGEEIRVNANNMALALETDSKKHDGIRIAQEGIAAGIQTGDNDPGISEADANKAYVDALAVENTAKGAHQKNDETQAELDKFRETHKADRPNVPEAQKSYDDAVKEEQDQDKIVADLEQKLQLAKINQATKRGDTRAAKNVLDSTKLRMEQWQARDELLKKEPENTLAVLQAAETARKAAEETLNQARAYKAYQKAVGEAHKAIEERDRLSVQAEALRAIAKGISARTGELLAKAGVPNITIKDGLLHYVHDDRTGDDGKPFSEPLDARSDGQMLEHAFRIALRGIRDKSRRDPGKKDRPAVAFVDSRLWGAQNDAGQAYIREKAGEHKVLIFATQVTNDPEFKIEFDLAQPEEF